VASSYCDDDELLDCEDGTKEFYCFSIAQSEADVGKMIYTNFGVKKLQRAARILEDKATDKSGSSLSVTPTSEEIEPLKEDVTKKSLTQVEEKKNDHDKDKDDSGKIWPIYKG
jgi:hypothetical protein